MRLCLSLQRPSSLEPDIWQEMVKVRYDVWGGFGPATADCIGIIKGQ